MIDQQVSRKTALRHEFETDKQSVKENLEEYTREKRSKEQMMKERG